MKALILAAGIGSRLRPITNNKPKTLVNINGKPILGYVLDSLESNGIREIVICVGFFSDLIINYCELNFPQLNFKFVENKEYDTTNNMYSLYLAKDYLDDDMLIMNGDVVFDKEIIKNLILQKGSVVAVDVKEYFEESMKIIVGRDNLVTGISKKFSKKEAYGCSIDIYKIDKKDLENIKKETSQIIEKDKDLNQWTEVMLDNLFKKGELPARPYDINKYKWCEVDNFEDLSRAEIQFNYKLSSLKNKKIFFIDRDGTLTLDNSKIDGTDNFIAALKKKGKKFYVVTNNSSRTPQGHLEVLNKAGLDISSKNILVSTQAAVEYFKENKIKRIFYLANKSVSNYLEKSGFILDDKNPQALLLTYDDEITYNKLVTFCNFVDKGIPYYATHVDVLYPSQKGFLPDIGSFIEIIKISTGSIPNLTFGKPNKMLIKNILKNEGLSHEDAVVIGDRLYTDIKLAEDSLITSVLVLSGETKRETYEDSSIKTDIIVNSVMDLIDYV